jgi:hypothetical protein
MIKQVSWESYWSTILIFLIFYYLIICFKYYLTDVKQFFIAKSRSTYKRILKNTIESKEVESSDTIDNLFPVLNQIIQEIKMMFEDSLRVGFSKPEFLFTIQLVLKKYPSIKGSPFQSIVNNYISSEFETNCSIHLDAEDLNGLWGTEG